jgi:hypothetical protein
MGRGIHRGGRIDPRSQLHGPDEELRDPSECQIRILDD